MYYVLWVNYANERSQAALERSNQDAYDVIRLTRSKAAVWTADDVAHWRVLLKLKKEFLFIYLSYEYSKRLVQPVVQPAAKCKRTFSHVLMATGFFTSYSGEGEVRPQNRHTANNLSTIVAVNNLRKTNPYV